MSKIPTRIKLLYRHFLNFNVDDPTIRMGDSIVKSAVDSDCVGNTNTNRTRGLAKYIERFIVKYGTKDMRKRYMNRSDDV